MVGLFLCECGVPLQGYFTTVARLHACVSLVLQSRRNLSDLALFEHQPYLKNEVSSLHNCSDVECDKPGMRCDVLFYRRHRPLSMIEVQGCPNHCVSKGVP